MKKRNNKYLEFIDIMNSLQNGEIVVTPKEVALMEDLQKVVENYKNNQILDFLFRNDDEMISLLELIDQNVEAFQNFILKNQDSLDSKIARRVLMYQEKCLRLTELKKRMTNYLDNQKSDISPDMQKILGTCAYTLMGNRYCFPNYFGKPFMESEGKDDSHFTFNGDTVQQVYDILEKDSLVLELKEGVDLLEREAYHLDVIRSVEEANEAKALIFRNLDLILRYNRLSMEITQLKKAKKKRKFYDINNQLLVVNGKIRSLKSNIIKRNFHKEELRELMKERSKLLNLKVTCDDADQELAFLEEEFRDINRRLMRSDLSKLLLRANTEQLLETTSLNSPYSLMRVLPTFQSFEDVSNYYASLLEASENSEICLKELAKEKKSYQKRTSKDALQLLTQDYDTARSIVEFTRFDSKGSLAPAIALFALRMLHSMNTTSLEEKGVTMEDLSNCQRYYHNLLEASRNRFFQEYVSIMNCEDYFSDKEKRV